jgi:hypothetical protein
MFRRSSLPVFRPVASPSSACLFPDLFAGASFVPVPKPRASSRGAAGKSERQSGSSLNTVVRPKIAKHCKISTYAKCVCNSRRISTYIFSALKSLWNQHLQKNREGAVHFLAAAFRQAEQPMINSRTAKGVPRAKVHAANVYQQDELRGVKEVIRSFRALTKSTPPLGGLSNP